MCLMNSQRDLLSFSDLSYNNAYKPYNTDRWNLPNWVLLHSTTVNIATPRA